MTDYFVQHRVLLSRAVEALATREFWTPFPEVPSTKIYGESAREDGQAAYAAMMGRPFDLPGHPQDGRVGAEVSPFGGELGITYPQAAPETLLTAALAAAPAWAAALPETRAGVCAEILVRLNKISFLLGLATQHTTGQAFAMAFQAGGPHAQDRGLEAVAMALTEMRRTPVQARWVKPQGRAGDLAIDKHWQVVPRGVGLVIGCNTFPTWNGYPGLFASLVTGNAVVVKPHPAAILPLAITVKVAREVLASAGFDPNTMLLAADSVQEPVTQALATDARVGIIDYTGSGMFGDWLRENARQARLYSEEAGVNSVVIAASHDFKGMCANLAFSLALYSGQMCTSPQNIYIPKHGIDTDEGHKSFDEVAQALAGAIDALLADPARAAGVLGAVANPASLARVAAARGMGRVIRDSAPLGEGRTATPLMICPDDPQAAQTECFGPISFVIPVADADAAIASAAALARDKGAITAALYDTDRDRIARAADAFARAGVNLSVNLTGNIFVNQSAAFSDYHVTGGNPAGNASLTDSAFIAGRFFTAMWREVA